MQDGTSSKIYGAAMLAADDRADRPEASSVDQLLARAYRVAVTEDREALREELQGLGEFLGEWRARLDRAAVARDVLPLGLEPAEARKEWSEAQP